MRRKAPDTTQAKLQSQSCNYALLPNTVLYRYRILSQNHDGKIARPRYILYSGSPSGVQRAGIAEVLTSICARYTECWYTGVLVHRKADHNAKDVG